VQAQLPGASTSSSTATASASAAPSSSKKSAKKVAKSAKKQATPPPASSPALQKMLKRSAQEWAGSVLYVARISQVLASALLDSRQLLDWLEVWCAVLPLPKLVNIPTSSQVVSQCSHH
jgi:hypothetical protein